MPPKWFYDDRGSELFDEITRLPEYYPTRTERGILVAHARDIAELTKADTLVELGSGTSEKTRLLLDALRDAGTLDRFVPFDVSEQTLRDAAAAVVAGVRTACASTRSSATSSTTSLTCPTGGTRLVAFLGSTIGNLAPAARATFLADLAATLAPGDALLLGTDLVKDVDRLVAAYDDAAGVTAEFNRNVLRVLDRELDADFEPGAVRPRRVLGRRRRVDRDAPAVARRAQSVAIRALDLDRRLRRRRGACAPRSAPSSGAKASSASSRPPGSSSAAWWTDPAADFALSLSFAR